MNNNHPKFIWSSSLDRGIDHLLYLWPFILKEFSEATLGVYYGHENWLKNIEATKNENHRKWLNSILEGMKQPGITYYGRTNQDTLAKAWLESDIWLYTCDFDETYCISALEAQISRTVCIASARAGLLTTIANRGILIPGRPHEKEYREQALKEVFAILHDDKRREQLTEKAYQWARQQTWDARAKEWMQIFGLQK